MTPSYRVLFLGQKPMGEAAWRKLRQIRSRRLKVVAICSNSSAEDAWWGSNEIRRSRSNTPFIDNKTRNEERLKKVIHRQEVNFILCVQHPWILSNEILRMVDYQAINIHNARLPDYGGFNTVSHALLNADKTYSCTAVWMTDQVDRGDIALEASFEIERTETALSLYAKSQLAGLVVFEEILKGLTSGKTLAKRPMAAGGRFHPRHSLDGLRQITKFEPEEMDRYARAFWFPPFEPAYFDHHGRKTHIIPNVASPSTSPRPIPDAGRILREALENARGAFRCRIR